MNTHHRYFKNTETGQIFDFWWAEQDGHIVASAEDTPLILETEDNPADVPLPEGFKDMTASAYTKAKNAAEAAERADFEKRYEAAKKRDSLLQKLLDGIL